MAERSTPGSTPESGKAADRYAGASGSRGKAGKARGGNDGAAKSLVPSRIVAIVLSLMFIGLLVAVGAFIYTKVTEETISGEVVASDVVSDGTTKVTVDITRSEPDKEGYCILQAKDYASAEIGRSEVYLPPGKQTSREVVEIDTTSRGYISDIYGCQYGKPAYLDPASADAN
ncbi:DUF4307 domain-containing protein [Dietzia sp.]|uniref:DUF4307 domain-containing protein n=1 Tax=Dietzia sp. TaxID=1871616 RepID=UPI002FD9C93E